MLLIFGQYFIKNLQILWKIYYTSTSFCLIFTFSPLYCKFISMEYLLIYIFLFNIYIIALVLLIKYFFSIAVNYIAAIDWGAHKLRIFLTLLFWIDFDSCPWHSKIASLFHPIEHMFGYWLESNSLITTFPRPLSPAR